MKIKEIHLSTSRTFNLGDYESLRVEAGVTVALDANGDIERARKTAIDEIRESLRAQHTAFKPNGGHS